MRDARGPIGTGRGGLGEGCVRVSACAERVRSEGEVPGFRSVPATGFCPDNRFFFSMSRAPAARDRKTAAGLAAELIVSLLMHFF